MFVRLRRRHHVRVSVNLTNFKIFNHLIIVFITKRPARFLKIILSPITYKRSVALCTIGSAVAARVCLKVDVITIV